MPSCITFNPSSSGTKSHYEAIFLRLQDSCSKYLHETRRLQPQTTRDSRKPKPRGHHNTKRKDDEGRQAQSSSFTRTTPKDQRSKDKNQSQAAGVRTGRYRCTASTTAGASVDRRTHSTKTTSEHTRTQAINVWPRFGVFPQVISKEQ